MMICPTILSNVTPVYCLFDYVVWPDCIPIEFHICQLMFVPEL